MTKNTKSFGTKIVNELKSLFWIFLYFFAWFGALMTLKVFLLQEYEFGFYGMSMVLVGALVVAKSVLILGNVPLTGSKSPPAIVEILLKTLLYMLGVFIILVLEKSLEARHEYGGFLPALKGLFSSTDRYHILVNIICIFGAVFFFNLAHAVKPHLGEGGLRKILTQPVPKKEKH